MGLIDEIIRFANEIGRTPDFVVRVSFWLLIAIGIILGFILAKIF